MTAPTNPSAALLTPYQPGKPVDELTRELGITDIIKLASNENPLGPSQRVLDTINANTGELSRYPDGNGFRLKQALSEHLQVPKNQITLGNGSNDVLELIAKFVLQPGNEGIIAEHSFVVYRLAVVSNGARLVTVPARHYGVDLDGTLAAITADTRIIFLANPNNPTGTWVNQQDLAGFLRAVPDNIWVVLDEAYYEYACDLPGYPDALALQTNHDNLLVTRTFSKAYGLAGLRVGYGLGSAFATDMMNRVRQPFNVNALALAAAETALQDQIYLERSRQANRAGIAQLEVGLNELDLNHIPSAGNFISIEFAEPAQPIYKALLQQGVIVRPIAEYGLPNHLRVTVGTEQENVRLLTALKSLVC